MWPAWENKIGLGSLECGNEWTLPTPPYCITRPLCGCYHNDKGTTTAVTSLRGMYGGIDWWICIVLKPPAELFSMVCRNFRLPIYIFCSLPLLQSWTMPVLLLIGWCICTSGHRDRICLSFTTLPANQKKLCDKKLQAIITDPAHKQKNYNCLL